jgi:hypothetical protein
MRKEVLILIISWVSVIIIYLWKVPRHLKGKAQITFLFGQAISWVYIFYSVYFKRIEFPFREFPYATKLSFSLHYMVYPAFAMFFEVTYPKSKNAIRIFIHYVLFVTITKLYGLFIENYTDLARPLKWQYLNVLIFAFLLFIIHHFVNWFQRESKEYNKII